MFLFVLEHRPPASPSLSDRQRWHIFPAKHSPRMSLVPALERLEKPQDTFPAGIFSSYCFPPPQNNRHQSFDWRAGNWRVLFILTHLLQVIPFAGCFMLPFAFCLLWDPGVCSQGRCLCSGCRVDAGDLPGSSSTHIPSNAPPPFQFLRHQTAGVKYAI